MKKKISSILFINLGIFGGITPCYAGSYTPNDLVDGRLPSYDNNITLTLGDGNWSKEIVLPQKPKNGDIVNVKSNAAWDSKIVGNIIGFGSIKVKANDRVELVYKPVTALASAWTLKDEASPNNGGVHIPNNKKYVAYFVANSNWDKHLYLPDTKGVAEKIVVRSEAAYDTYIDHRMIAGSTDLKISTNQVVIFTWNSTLNKWSVFKEGDSDSLQRSVRPLAFLDMSLDTSTQGTDLYNNGRMQKPIAITYKACLLNDYEQNDYRCNPVQITEDEIKYYIRLGIYRRNDGNYPEELADIYPEFVIDYEQDMRYETRLPVSLNKQKTAVYMDEKAALRTATIWLRYKPNSLTEQRNVDLCTFSVYEDQEGNSIPGAYTNDCGPDGFGSPARRLSVIDGSYQGSITDNLGILKQSKELIEICSNENDCGGRPGWRTRNGWARGISYAKANLYKYSARRAGHHFLPATNTKSTELSRGCVKDATGGSDSKDDGICGKVTSGDYADYSFYTSNLQFGETKTVELSYTNKQNKDGIIGFHYDHRDSWQFDPNIIDLDRYGTFSIYSVLPVIDFRSDDLDTFVMFSGWHWAGSTQTSEIPIESFVEDNYGNRFKFSATLYAEPKVGAAGGKSKNYALTRVKDEKFVPVLE
ncbi:TPA: hypothetical protein I6209_002086 [Vibrio cholerae]|uniref:hypothetical protein n=1 Tax=Vibrio cholerae TaxID=666 RepID=UPI001A206106|nr:hypothetical protein [Vibrio cholerae]MCX9515135.1 hypothetical protein [Vibrio cholerae]HAS3629565.1 hypothetical protein [Vibrio cholerae]HDI3211813.1 hypothetical protein [Vibrio cholerae]